MGQLGKEGSGTDSGGSLDRGEGCEEMATDVLVHPPLRRLTKLLLRAPAVRERLNVLVGFRENPCKNMYPYRFHR